MLFLVTGKYTEPGALLPPEQVVPFVKERVIPSLAMWAKWEEQGKIKAGGVLAGQREGVFILEANSGEELGEVLTSLPFWHDLTWDIKPLQSMRSAAERERRLVQQIEAAAKP